MARGMEAMAAASGADAPWRDEERRGGLSTRQAGRAGAAEAVNIFCGVSMPRGNNTVSGAHPAENFGITPPPANRTTQPVVAFFQLG